MSVLAAAMEADALSMYKSVYHQVNNQASAATLAKLLAGRKRLKDSLAPGDYKAVINTQDNVDLVTDSKALFNNNKEIGDQYKEGSIGRAASFDFYENTLLVPHARGAAAATYTTSTLVGVLPLVSTPVSAITVATGTGAFAAGDIFTIGNVFEVHPETKVSTGRLQQFVCEAGYVGGAGSLTFSPAIVLAGGRQNVIIPATSATAAIAVAGSISTNHGMGLLFNPDAFTFATADLVMPQGLDFSAREVMDGISMRIARQYDITNDKFPTRLDVLYGFKCIRPELAVRFANN